jgi:hypothetical protein
MNLMFTNEQIDSLTTQAQRGLMKIGSHVEPNFNYSYNWSAIPLMNALLKMDNPLTINGIMRNRPGQRESSNKIGYTVLRYYLIPLFLETSLLMKNTEDRFERYMPTPELKELLTIWLGNNN